jgi:hypothetical protein
VIGAMVTGAMVTGAMVTGAMVTGAMVTGAMVTGAMVTGAMVTNAMVTGAMVTGAMVTGAMVTGAMVAIAPTQACHLGHAGNRRAPASPSASWCCLPARHARRLQVRGYRARDPKGGVNGLDWIRTAVESAVRTASEERGCESRRHTAAARDGAACTPPNHRGFARRGARQAQMRAW